MELHDGEAGDSREGAEQAPGIDDSHPVSIVLDNSQDRSGTNALVDLLDVMPQVVPVNLNPRVKGRIQSWGRYGQWAPARHSQCRTGPQQASARSKHGQSPTAEHIARNYHLQSQALR